MSVHDLAAGIHQILDSACHSHLLCSRLLCFNYGIINFVVTLDLDKLIGAIRHLRKEVRIILADSAGLRVVVVDREIALVGGEHILSFPGKEKHELFLNVVCVLVFIDHDVRNRRAELVQNIFVIAEKPICLYLDG